MFNSIGIAIGRAPLRTLRQSKERLAPRVSGGPIAKGIMSLAKVMAASDVAAEREQVVENAKAVRACLKAAR